MRQTILTSILFASSVIGTITIFNLAAIVPLINGNSLHFSQTSAKHRSL